MNLKVGWGLADLGWCGWATLLLALGTAGHGFSLRFAFKSATCVLGLRPHEGDSSCVKKLFSHPGRGASKRASGNSQASQSLGSEWAHCHFCFNLLVKASHTAKVKGGEYVLPLRGKTVKSHGKDLGIERAEKKLGQIMPLSKPSCGKVAVSSAASPKEATGCWELVVQYPEVLRDHTEWRLQKDSATVQGSTTIPTPSSGLLGGMDMPGLAATSDTMGPLASLLR